MFLSFKAKMRDAQTNSLEGIISFVSENAEKRDVTGFIVFLEYPLVNEETPAGVLPKVRPTIRCQALGEGGIVYGKCDLRLDAYDPIETFIEQKQNEHKIENIGERLRSMANMIIGYIRSRELKAVLYPQNPPSVEVFNDILKRENHNPTS